MDLDALIAYDDRQRMIPVDAAALRAAVAAYATGDTYRQQRMAGVGCVVLGDYDRAFMFFERARRHADTPARRLVLDMNVADAHRYRGDLAESERRFRDALRRARESDTYVDFALQHLGKCLIDRGRLPQARRVLTEALRLRVRDGDESLIASTQAALALT